MKERRMNVFPLFTRQVLPQNRIVTACVLVDDRGQLLSFGQAIRSPEDEEDTGFAFRTAARRAAKALTREKTDQLSRWNSLPRYAYLSGHDLTLQPGSHISMVRMLDILWAKAGQFIDKKEKYSPLDWSMVEEVDERPAFVWPKKKKKKK